jgi:UDP-N-acetyl-D-glucosamine dehydrogenase
LGVAYKPNIDDARESPALDIIDKVIHKGGIASYHDPFIPAITTNGGHRLTSVPYDVKTLSDADAVVITTKHAAFKSQFIMEHARLIIDLQNLIISDKSKNIYKL